MFGDGGIAVAIHRRTVIGRDVMISPHVLIGGRSGLPGFPVIGDNVFIASGAKILGNVTIGNNVTIGANAVVLKDVPDNAIVVGIPAKIIKYHTSPKTPFMDF